MPPEARAPTPARRIAVVGASGSIGLAVCEDLARDWDVVALTRFEPPRADAGAESRIDWWPCDLFARTRVEADLEGCDVDVSGRRSRTASSWACSSAT